MTKIKPNYAALGRKYNCDPRTIKRYLTQNHADKRRNSKRRSSKLDPYREIIKDKYQTCSATAIFYFIKELGYEGGISILRDYCHQLKKANNQKPIIRIETAPGEVGQVDWKEDMVLHTRQNKPIHFSIFLYVLGYSRRKFLKLVFDRRQDTLFECLNEAFSNTEGVPHQIYFDNMKTAVDHARSNFHKVVWNEKLLNYAKAAGFLPKSCRPFRPQTKGKVEALARTIERIKVYDHEFSNEEELGQIIKHLQKQLNDEKSQATDRRPMDLWQKEKEYLQPFNSELLSSLVDHDLTRKVSKESMISYLGSKYSVPIKYIGHEVTVKVTDKNLLIFSATKLIRQHLLSNKKFNYHQEDMTAILKTSVFHDLSDQQLAEQVETNLKMFDQL
ncbi:IS21 family transposase [Limosilactobacillus coleohominis]|nr:IS21 family transposase [Limosilactobacillus coleohominis]